MELSKIHLLQGMGLDVVDEAGERGESLLPLFRSSEVCAFSPPFSIHAEFANFAWEPTTALGHVPAQPSTERALSRKIVRKSNRTP